MIKIIEQDLEDKSTNFLMYSLKTNIVNSLRRIMLSDYENNAFNQTNINIIENTSVLHNEIMKHRISLVPLNVTENITIELNVKNNTKNILNVYSNDMTITNGTGEIAQDILLLKLKKNQSLHFTATSDLNNCKNGGIIYRPIVTSYFKIIKQISICDNIEEGKQLSIKKHLMEENDLFEEDKIYKKNDKFDVLGLLHSLRSNTNFVQFLCDKFHLRKTDLKVEMLYYDKLPVYSFNIESFFIDPIDIINHSLVLLKENCLNLLNLDIEIEEEPDKIKLFIKNECPTILNPICCFLRENEKINFANYNKLHPLDDFIILQISLQDTNDNYLKILKQTLENITLYIDNLLLIDLFKLQH